MNNKDVFKAFISGDENGNNPNKSLFIEHDVLYSYGYHFPLCLRLEDGTFIFNKSKYSVTTSKQQSQLKSLIFSNIHEVTTTELKEILNIRPNVTKISQIVTNKLQ